MQSENREAWLTELAKRVEPVFSSYGKVHPYRITCGWPHKGGVGLRRRVVGECHPHQTSKAALHEIFISPTIAEPLHVAGVTCHELAHVVAGTKAQHGARFVAVCKHVGLTKGKATQVLPGALLEERLQKIIDVMGDYPHDALEVITKVKSKPSVVGLICECGCKVSMSYKWIEQAGLPTCACGKLFAMKEED